MMREGKHPPPIKFVDNVSWSLSFLLFNIEVLSGTTMHGTKGVIFIEKENTRG